MQIFYSVCFKLDCRLLFITVPHKNTPQLVAVITCALLSVMIAVTVVIYYRRRKSEQKRNKCKYYS